MAVSHLPEHLTGVELRRVSDALGVLPALTQAEAHVYPAAAPAYQTAPEAQRERLRSNQLRLYVHIPFCNYKCNFCYFATRVGDDRQQQVRYVAALERELEWTEAGTPLLQLFMGGGTPTVLETGLLDRILDRIFERHPPVRGQVHTVEASPESVTDAHVQVLQANGIGRVSMGIQSLDDRILAGVQRRHGREQVMDAIDRLVGSEIITNVDLMYGLPGQTRASFASDLTAVSERGVHSLTLYNLRTNKRRAVGRALREEERLDLARLIEWRSFVRQAAAEHGFSQTRWHTYKRAASIAARHERAPCFDEEVRGFQVGIGMSARSHIGFSIYRNHRAMPTYLGHIEAGRSPVHEVFRLGVADRRTQFVARTIGDGKALERSAYRSAFDRPIEADFGEPLERLMAAGLISDRDDALFLSPIGRLVYDRVMMSFYPRHAIEWLWKQAD